MTTSLARHLRSGVASGRRTAAALVVGALCVGCGGDASVNAPRSGAPADSVKTPPSPPPPASSVGDTTVITVDAARAYQAIAGFGGTTLPLVYGGRDYLGTLRPAALDAAFRQVGLSRGLLQIGVTEAPAGSVDPYGQRRNDNDDPFRADASGFNFAGLATLRAAVLQPAAALGFASLELGPMLDLRGPLDWLKPVRAASYERYLDESAESVLATLVQWRLAYGQTPALIHLFNEPTSGNSELGTGGMQEVVDLVKRTGLRLRANGFTDTKFVVPNEETMQRTLAVARAILSDPVARPFVGVIGFHQYPYGSVSASPRRLLETSGAGAPDAGTRAELEALRSLSAEYGVPLWMTEVSEGPGNSDYAFDAIEHVLARVIHVHDTFRYGGAQAYFGMHAIWDSRSHADHFAGRNIPFMSGSDDMVLVDVERGLVRISGLGYAVGHHARWLGVGARLLESSSGSPRVPVSAFRDPATGRIVVVATNATTTAQLLRVRASGAVPSGTFVGEVSHASVRWQPISGVAGPEAGVIEFIAPPRSVVTLAIPVR